MGESTNNVASLRQRIEELEREREELQKDVEQLCMQQAGTGYISVITRIQAQRTASFEKEIETLKKKLIACVRDNHNLQEELSEVYRVKSQLADLHKLELEKNYEAEQQIKFFQSSVAAAFSERDRALMEVEKVCHNERELSAKVHELQSRVEELTDEYTEQKRLCSELKTSLVDSTIEISKIKQVVDKFYTIRQMCLGETIDEINVDKVQCLIQDPIEFWSYNEVRDEGEDKSAMDSIQAELSGFTTKIKNLEQELEEAYASKEMLLKENGILELQLKQSHKDIMKKVSCVRSYCKEHITAIKDLLEDHKRWWESATTELAAHVIQLDMQRNIFDLITSTENISCICPVEERCDGSVDNGNLTVSNHDKQERYSVSVASNYKENLLADDSEKALEQALQEKVQTLLLLSQQEERYLLENNTKAALEEKIKELQEKLLQVTNEKVSALMEVAQLKQECSNLQYHGRKPVLDSRQQQDLNTNAGPVNERESKGRHLLKNTFLKQWLRGIDIVGSKAITSLEDGKTATTSKSKDAMEFARLKVENASLQENMSTLEHLTSVIHRLRLSLLKIKEDAKSSSANSFHIVEEIISEAQHIKTALGSSLPVSWLAESDSDLSNSVDSEIKQEKDQTQEVVGIDSVSAAGFELIELLILAAKLQKVELMQISKNTMLAENTSQQEFN